MLDNRSSAYIERLHAESLHHKAAMEIAKTEAESHRTELARQEDAHAAVRGELQDALERAETAELKLDVYERSREEMEADIQAKLSRMSAVHEVELNGQQANRLQAELQHLTLQAALQEEDINRAEHEAAQRNALHKLAAAVAERKHRAHDEATRELEEARSQHEAARHQAAVELRTVREQARLDRDGLVTEHAAHSEQLTADLRATTDALSKHSLQLKAIQNAHAEEQASLTADNIVLLTQLEAIQKAHAEKQATLTADNTVLQEQLRDEIARAEMLSAGHAERLSREIEAASSLRTQVTEAHTEQMATKDTALREAQSAHSTALRDLQVARGEVAVMAAREKQHHAAVDELQAKHSRTVQELQTDHSRTVDELQADHSRTDESTQRLQVEYDELLLKFEQLQKSAVADTKAARVRDEAHKMELEQRSQEIVRLQGQSERREAELSSVHTELERVQTDLAAALEDKGSLQRVSTELSHEIERKDATLKIMQSNLMRLQHSTSIMADNDAQNHTPIESSAGVRVAFKLTQERKGFGMHVSDNLCVESLTLGGAAEQAGVPVPSKIVEVAGQLVSTKQEMVKAVTGEHDRASRPVPPLVSFTFLTEPTASEATGPATAGSEDALTKLSQPLVDEVLRLEYKMTEEQAAVSGELKTERRALQALQDEMLQLQEAHAKELARKDAAHNAVLAQLSEMRNAHEALQEEMMQSEETTGEISSALQQTEKDLAAKDILHNEVSVEVASLRRSQSLHGRDLQAAQLKLREAEEQLRQLQHSHAALNEEMLTKSTHATSEIARLTQINAETSRRLEAETKRHAAAETALKQTHSTVLAQHTEQARLLKLGYDQLDEDYLAISQSQQDAAVEVGQLKTKLAASLRQTAEAERSAQREQAARSRAEAAQMELQRSLEELAQRSGMVEEQLAVERSSVRDTPYRTVSMVLY